MDVILSPEFVPSAHSLVWPFGLKCPFLSTRDILAGEDVALFQGTFDPFTLAHAEAVSLALLHCDRVLVYPTNRNSKKMPAALHHRVEIIRRTIRGFPKDMVAIVCSSVHAPFPKFIVGCEAHLRGRYIVMQGVEKLHDLPWYSNSQDPGRFIVGMPHLICLASESEEVSSALDQIEGPTTILRCTLRMRSSDLLSQNEQTFTP